jgi:hypothetical protein
MMVRKTLWRIEAVTATKYDTKRLEAKGPLAEGLAVRVYG